MKIKIIGFALLSLVYGACNQNNSHEDHNHSDNDHEVENEDIHYEHEEEKVQYTAYSSEFELFAESDEFVVGEQVSILAHFSELPNFKPLDNAQVKATLTTNGKEISQIQKNPLRKGIYQFTLKPEEQGKASLNFEISNTNGNFIVAIPDIDVYGSHHDEEESHESHEESSVNTVVFTKEQSWKIDFATELANTESFEQVIKTVAKVEPARGEESVITAKMSGIVVFPDNELVEGKKVTSGQKLFTLSSNEMAENNISVRLAEAKTNFETSKANFERESMLVKDKLISEHEFLDAKNQYEAANAIYENLIKNFSESGQKISSDLTGYINRIYVTNGQYVEEGQALVSISKNKTLLLTAHVQQKYLELLPSIVSANIKTLYNSKVYSFDELNGKILSYGKSVSGDSYLIPVSLQIENRAGFTPGTLAEVFLKTASNSNVLSIPITSFIEEQGLFYVFVQINPELFEKREVKIGGTDGLRTEIIQGLAANERIVTRGATQIKLAQSTGALDPHSGHVH